MIAAVIHTLKRGNSTGLKRVRGDVVIKVNHQHIAKATTITQKKESQ